MGFNTSGHSLSVPSPSYSTLHTIFLELQFSYDSFAHNVAVGHHIPQLEMEPITRDPS